MSRYGKSAMDMFKSFKTICSFTVISTAFACSGVHSAMSISSQNTPAVVSKISAHDWQQLISGDRATHSKVAFRIKITDVSNFGGFYVKGHLLDTKSARIHLVWPPDATPSGSARNSLIEGAIVTITGDLEGVTTEKEALISVTECKR